MIGMLGDTSSGKDYKSVDQWLAEWKEKPSTAPPPLSNPQLEALAKQLSTGTYPTEGEAQARLYGQWQWVWDRAENITAGKAGPPLPADALVAYMAANKDKGGDSGLFGLSPVVIVLGVVVVYHMLTKKK